MPNVATHRAEFPHWAQASGKKDPWYKSSAPDNESQEFAPAKPSESSSFRAAFEAGAQYVECHDMVICAALQFASISRILQVILLRKGHSHLLRVAPIRSNDLRRVFKCFWSERTRSTMARRRARKPQMPHVVSRYNAGFEVPITSWCR